MSIFRRMRNGYFYMPINCGRGWKLAHEQGRYMATNDNEGEEQ